MRTHLSCIHVQCWRVCITSMCAWCICQEMTVISHHWINGQSGLPAVSCMYGAYFIAVVLVAFAWRSDGLRVYCDDSLKCKQTPRVLTVYYLKVKTHESSWARTEQHCSHRIETSFLAMIVRIGFLSVIQCKSICVANLWKSRKNALRSFHLNFTESPCSLCIMVLNSDLQ